MLMEPGAFSVDRVVAGPSPRMRAIHDAVRGLSAVDRPVLFTGETGTGKELLARVLHATSARRGGPFVTVSCAMRPESLLESELFGHAKGAFPGADEDRPGRYERADGGTLFIEDVDAAPASVQVRLVRAIQDGAVERLGGTAAVTVDVRVVASSRSALGDAVARGVFRADFYHLLSATTLALPPLRERREDIAVLARFFIDLAARRRGIGPPAVPPHVLLALERYAWPGNVRELEALCARAAQTCSCGTVRIGCLAPEILFSGEGLAPATVPAEPVETGLAMSLDDRLAEIEVGMIGWALRATHGNKSRAAELLHIKRTTLADRITRHAERLAPDLAPAGSRAPHHAETSA